MRKHGLLWLNHAMISATNIHGSEHSINKPLQTTWGGTIRPAVYIELTLFFHQAEKPFGNLPQNNIHRKKFQEKR